MEELEQMRAKVKAKVANRKVSERDMARAISILNKVIKFLNVTVGNGKADDDATLAAIADAFWKLDVPMRVKCFVDVAGGSASTDLRDSRLAPAPRSGNLGSVANLLRLCGAELEKAKQVASAASERALTR